MPMYLNVLDACEDDVQMKSPGGMTERSICIHPGPPNSSPMALPLASVLLNFFSSPGSVHCRFVFNTKPST